MSRIVNSLIVLGSTIGSLIQLLQTEYPIFFQHGADESVIICSEERIWDREALVDELPDNVFCVVPMTVLAVPLMFPSREKRIFSMEPTNTIGDLMALIERDSEIKNVSIRDGDRQLEPRSLMCSVMFGAVDKVLWINGSDAEP
jgi:hypothetical protein